MLLAAAAPMAVTAQSEGICGAAYANSVGSAAELRHIKGICDLYTDGYARALYRLNTFPVPETVPKLALRSRLENVQVHRVVLEADVFFNWLEAYPIDVGFGKLEELLAAMNTGFAIEQIQIVGSADPVESELPSVRVGERRADFLRSYFIAAGADPRRVVATTRQPVHPNSLEGRARDRSVALRVVMLRQRAVGPQ